MTNQPLPREAEAAADPEALFKAHAGWLRQALSRRFGAEVAEDLVQETYLRLVRRGKAEPLHAPRGFLMRIAHNLFVDQRRRQAARSHADQAPDPAINLGSAAQLELLALKQTILGMPDPLRQVFLLSRFGGQSYQSIALHLNISVKTVEWRMSKALLYCAERLRD